MSNSDADDCGDIAGAVMESVNIALDFEPTLCATNKYMAALSMMTLGTNCKTT
jgi:hypothetical protein